MQARTPARMNVIILQLKWNAPSPRGDLNFPIQITNGLYRGSGTQLHRMIKEEGSSLIGASKKVRLLRSGLVVLEQGMFLLRNNMIGAAHASGHLYMLFGKDIGIACPHGAHGARKHTD